MTAHGNIDSCFFTPEDEQTVTALLDRLYETEPTVHGFQTRLRQSGFHFCAVPIQPEADAASVLHRWSKAAPDQLQQLVALNAKP